MEIVLAHGASGNAASMAPYVDGLRERRLSARAIDLPVGKAERAVDAYRAQAPELGDLVIGGHSYGGRVASLLAADEAPRALVLLSYPLHRPGGTDWQARVAHWPAIACPVLLLSGEADPFARISWLREAVGLLPHHTLITYPGVRHGLKPVLDQALGRIEDFVRGL
jgi:predicted alpha/beta-hydrolase family hydrolase